MSTDMREERLTRRVAELYATDEQFAAARPSDAITAAMERPGLRLREMVRRNSTWVRFARRSPFHGVGVVVLAAVAGGQHPHPGSEFDGNIDDVDPVGA